MHFLAVTPKSEICTYNCKIKRPPIIISGHTGGEEEKKPQPKSPSQPSTSIIGQGGGEFCIEVLTRNLHFNRPLLSICFTGQNYSLTLNLVKKFPLFCYSYFLIFKY